MGRAKEIIVKVIPSKIAVPFVKEHHYSGKVKQNSSLHFGCFLDGKLHGVMSYGTSNDKSKMLGLVENTNWNDYLELNRMAFDDYLPKNSESRCIAISIKLIKQNAPHIKWILSFSDGTQCGDGTIYRASGFVLTQINKSFNLALKPNGEVDHKIKYESNPISTGYFKVTGGKNNWRLYCEKMGWQILEGYQLRYIYLIDKTCKITVPILPFSKIDEMGAGMYKGEKVSLQERKQNAAIAHLGERLASSQEGAFDATMPLNSLI